MFEDLDVRGIERYCEKISKEINEIIHKDISAGTLETAYKLFGTAHYACEMIDKPEKGGYSGSMPWFPRYYGDADMRGRNMDEQSFRGPSRGRGSDADRDNMGRYSGDDGYSYRDDAGPMIRR